MLGLNVRKDLGDFMK